MQLLRFKEGYHAFPYVGLLEGSTIHVIESGPDGLSKILHSDDPVALIERKVVRPQHDLASVEILAPIDHQEIWASGVTYERSKVARQEESTSGGSFYDLVYRAERPELFFKATPNRVAGPGKPIRVRADTKWCVPEPELALVISPKMELVGYTIGNDVSARDIEGENPLYLPQAKVYQDCCSIGPCITLAASIPSIKEQSISLEIERAGQPVFQGSTSLGRIVREFSELIGWLGRDNNFPNGVILLTGTGIVPPDEFTLHQDDIVRITVPGIGTLENPVFQSPAR